MGALVVCLALIPWSAWAGQDGPPVSAVSDQHVEAVLDALDEMRRQFSENQAELRQLRREVAELKAVLAIGRVGNTERANLVSYSPPAPEGPAPQTVARARQDTTPHSASQLSSLEEEQELQRQMLETLYQSKVESGSRYRVRLSGMALVNGFFTSDGGGENFDVPELAAPVNPLHAGRSFGTTMRQSLLGLSISGPTVGGARTSGELQFDFFGGFPKNGNGETAGLARLRTGAMRLEWPSTTVVLGQTEPFVSPLSPTSLASVAVPSLSYSGNLWAWVPQVSVEHRHPLANGSALSLTGGILDPLTGDNPVTTAYFLPGAGHRGGLPAVAGRLGWQNESADRPLVIGVGGYYSRQDWGRDRIVNGWATTADWVIPVGRQISFSGEFYSGRAFGGLGAGENGSVLFDGDPGQTSTRVQGLRSTGGWLQAAFALSNRIEFNTAVGQDAPSDADLERFRLSPGGGESPIGRNRTGLVNVILRARSNLLFSGEFRTIWTARPDGTRRRARHLNFAAGVLF